MIKIEVRHVMEHYEIYVNGQFEISCDENELSQIIEEVEQKYNG
jgi:hypothetical protein